MKLRLCVGRNVLNSFVLKEMIRKSGQVATLKRLLKASLEKTLLNKFNNTEKRCLDKKLSSEFLFIDFYITIHRSVVSLKETAATNGKFVTKHFQNVDNLLKH